MNVHEKQTNVKWKPELRRNEEHKLEKKIYIVNGKKLRETKKANSNMSNTIKQHAIGR